MTACICVSCDEPLPREGSLCPECRRQMREVVAPVGGEAKMREALERIDAWCCPVFCSNCADNRKTAREALASTRQP